MATDPLHLLFDHVTEGLLLAAPDGRTLAANPAALALATELGVDCTLDAMLGDATALTSRAQRDGTAHTLLPLVRDGVRGRILRVTACTAGGDGVMAAAFVDVTREMTAYEDLVARNHEMDVLRDMGGALSDQHDLGAICDLVYRHASRLLNTGDFMVCVVEPRTGRIEVPYRVRGFAPVAPPPAPRAWAAGPLECVIESRQPLSFARDPDAECAALRLAADEPLGRSWLGVPMIAGGAAIGAIVVQDFERPGRFTAQDVAVLGIVGSQAATAIHSARLLADARRAFVELAETQSRLLESERLRTVNETVGALSHEINNPLATISGNAQLLLRQDGLDPDLRAKLARILAAAQRIEAVTTRMSNLIQAASTRYPGDTPIIDLARSRTRDEAAADGDRHAA